MKSYISLPFLSLLLLSLSTSADSFDEYSLKNMPSLTVCETPNKDVSVALFSTSGSIEFKNDKDEKIYTNLPSGFIQELADKTVATDINLKGIRIKKEIIEYYETQVPKFEQVFYSGVLTAKKRDGSKFPERYSSYLSDDGKELSLQVSCEGNTFTD